MSLLWFKDRGGQLTVLGIRVRHRPQLHRRLRQASHLRQGPSRAQPVLLRPQPPRSLHRPV